MFTTQREVDRQAREAFDAEQKLDSGGLPSVKYDGYIYFANGAYREASISGSCAWPSTYPPDLHRDITTYYRVRCKVAVERFDYFKQSLLDQPDSYKEGQTAINKLKELKAAVREAEKAQREHLGQRFANPGETGEEALSRKEKDEAKQRDAERDRKLAATTDKMHFRNQVKRIEV